MKQLSWWLVEIFSRLLTPDERDAARGDIAERGESAGQALRDILSLAVRRQAELWRGWRPWLALAGIAIPLGMLLTVVSRRTAHSSAIYLWLYVNNWDPAFIENASFRRDLVSFAVGLLLGCLMLACWSWTAGLALGFLSRAATPVNGALFILMLGVTEILGTPAYLRIAPLFHRGGFGANAAVFEGTFYRVIFPLIVQAALVMLPALWGMRQGIRQRPFSGVRSVVLGAAAIATVSAIALQGLVWWRYAFLRPVTLDGELKFLTCWPVVYLAVSAVERFRSARLKENHV